MRPTPDRVREAVFNALHSLDAIEDAVVLDLFAGSGALGIEALSRGARHVTFVDADRSAAGLVQQNLDALGLADRATVVRSDARRWITADRGPFDLALLDPPYDQHDWPELLATLPATLAVLESKEAPVLPEGWSDLRQRRYGSTLVTIIRRTPSPE